MVDLSMVQVQTRPCFHGLPHSRHEHHVTAWQAPQRQLTCIRAPLANGVPGHSRPASHHAGPSSSSCLTPVSPAAFVDRISFLAREVGAQGEEEVGIPPARTFENDLRMAGEVGMGFRVYLFI